MALDSLFVETPSLAPSAASVGVPAPFMAQDPSSVSSVPSLPRRNALRVELGRLHGHIIRLRCEDPNRGTRANALEYQRRRIVALAEDSVDAGGTEDGWPDPEDDLADGDQIQGLRVELAELIAGEVYPLALSEGCSLLPVANFDLLGHGRLGNGRLGNGKVSSGGLMGGLR